MAINQRVRFRVFARDNFTCQYCGKSAPHVVLEVDHRHPVSRGGDDLESNLLTACQACNRGKFNTLLPVELTLSGGGPIDGWVMRSTAYTPLVWVWTDPDGKVVTLIDEMISSLPDGFGWSRAKYGPSWANKLRPNHEEYLERLRWRDRPDGAISMLCGAYVADDCYPFHHFKQLSWQEPWQMLLQLDQTAGRANG